MKEGVHKKIEEALNSLDGMQRAEANPFLYGKIRYRLEGVKEFFPKQLAWRVVIALAIVAVINLFTFFHFNSEKKNSGAEIVAKEYSIGLSHTY
jgi:hypothetical protein